MKKLIVFIASAFLTMGFSSVYAAEYEITVIPDETTSGDMQLVADFASTAADGAVVSKSMRRVAMAAVGEVTLSAEGRVDGYDNLTMDDGSTTALVGGDLVKAEVPVRGNCTDADSVCVVISFDQFPSAGCMKSRAPADTGNGCLRPTALSVKINGVVVASTRIPPNRMIRR